jgi:anti-sigma factor RsiW
VYGELGPEEQLKWENHLATCKACLQEQKRLIHLLENVKEAMPESLLSRESARVLHTAITEKLTEKHHRAWWRNPFLAGYVKPMHVAAVCGMLVVAFAWFGVRGIQQSPTVKIASDIGVEERMIVKHIDILENLDLLEEMDTLEKLDQVMGRKNVTI